MPEITVTPDGSERTVEPGTTAGELAASIGRGRATAAVIAVIEYATLDDDRDPPRAIAGVDDAASSCHGVSRAAALLGVER